MNKDLLIDANNTILNALEQLNSLRNISRLILFVVKAIFSVNIIPYMYAK